MRALLIIVLISAAFADDAVHYPTNHPGVCNILAFVSDHVDEVVHVAHDEIEAATDKRLESSTALMKEIQKVKRQVKDIMQVAQCLVADVKKENTVENAQEIPLATSEDPLHSLRDVVHLPESSTTTTQKPQTIGEGKQPEIVAKLKQIATQSADKPQQVFQHVAEIQDAKRLVRDVVHLLKNISTSETVKEAQQVELVGNSKETQSQVAANPLQSSQPTNCVDNKLTQVPDLVNLLGSFLHTADAKQESAGNIVEPFPSTLEQHVATQKRRRRNVVKAIDLEIFKNLESKRTDTVQKDIQHESLQRTARDVAQLLVTQNILPCHLENEIKVENNLHNLKSDYFQTADILPEETQHVVVQETGAYADQLFPPTIGQHVDFQERLKRNAVNIIEDDVNLPPKDSQYIASAETAPRSARDVVHLLETHTTLKPSQEQLTSSVQQPADIRPQASQHVAEQQCKENVKENLAPTMAQNSATSLGHGEGNITFEIPQTVNSDIHKVSHPQLQHVAIQENDVKVEATTVPHNLRRKRNVEIGRNGAVSNAPQEYNVLKSKSKRSPDDFQVSLDQLSQSDNSVNSQELKYIQIVKPRSIGERTRRSEDVTLKAKIKPFNIIKKVKAPQDLHTKDDRFVEIVTPPRVVRSLPVTLEKPKEFPNQHHVGEEHSQHVANLDVPIKGIDLSSDIPSSTSTQNPIDSQEDIREFLQPTVKVQHPGLPLTQFARRNTVKEAR